LGTRFSCLRPVTGTVLQAAAKKQVVLIIAMYLIMDFMMENYF
jgi:hypothetical protein